MSYTNLRNLKLNIFITVQNDCTETEGKGKILFQQFKLSYQIVFIFVTREHWIHVKWQFEWCSESFLLHWRQYHCWQTRSSGNTPSCVAQGLSVAGALGWNPSDPLCGCGRGNVVSTCAGWWQSHYQTPQHALMLQRRQRRKTWENRNALFLEERFWWDWNSKYCEANYM